MQTNIQKENKKGGIIIPMEKRIRFEETEKRLNLWVDGHQYASIIKEFVLPHLTPFQYLCTMMDEQTVRCSDGTYSYIWYAWLEQLYEEGKLTE